MGHVASIRDRLETIIDHPDMLRSFKHHARTVLDETGHLPETPMWDYLHWLRGLNPRRFDAHHPFDKLFRDEGGRLPTLAPEAPVMPLGPSEASAPVPSPSAVPEPSSSIPLGLAMVLLVAWYMRSRR